MTAYYLIKLVHVSCAVLSVCGFTVRGIRLWRQVDWLQQRWVRIVPHINDTLLLTSAIALAALSHQYPGQQAWLTAKVLALLLYIALGMIAFRFARSPLTQRLCWLLALLVAIYILGTAVSRNSAWPLLAFI